MSADSLPSRLASFRRAYLSPVLFILFVAQIAVGALWLAFTFPVQIDLSFPEGALVAGAREAALGRSPYQDWREWPHVFAPYAPLTYCGVGAAARLAGRPEDAGFIYLLGRGQSLAAIAGICVLIGSIAVPRALSGGRAALAASVPIAFLFLWAGPISSDPGPLLVFVASYRPDAPQVFFSILALTVALRGEPTPRRAALALASLFVAMWFKPMAWGMTVTLAIWVARARGWRTALRYIAVFAGAGLAAAALLNFALGGRLFLNMVAALDNGIRPSNFLQLASRMELLPALVFSFAITEAGLAAMRHTSREPMNLLHVAFAFSLAATALQYLKAGADINYCLEPYALACVLAAGALFRFWDDPRGPKANRELVLAFLLPAIYLLAWLPAMASAHANLAGLRKLWGELSLSRRVASVTGEILTTNPFLGIVRPAPPTIMDHVQYGILVERGILSDEALIDRVRRRAFALVILPAPEMEKPAFENASLARLYSPRLLPELKANYEEFQRAGVLVLLRPKKDSASHPD